MSSNVRFDTGDFDFQVDTYESENMVKVPHLQVSKEHRGEGYGSIILETIKRIVLSKN